MLTCLKVWDRLTFQIKTTLTGHTGSVLALEIARDREWLFSSSSLSSHFYPDLLPNSPQAIAQSAFGTPVP